MRRTTVYLSDDLKNGLERLATQLHRSEAELMREAVGNLLASLRPARQPLGPIFDIPETLSDRVDELLAEGFGRD